MDKDVLIALIGVGGLAVTGLFGYLSERRKRIDSELSVAMDVSGFDFSAFFTNSRDVYSDIKEIVNSTEITSWSLFKSWNGSQAPLYTTSTVQITSSDNDRLAIKRSGLDHDWQNKLEVIKREPELIVKTKEMPESRFRDVMLADGDTGAILATIGHHDRGKGKAMHTWSAFTTDTDDGTITPETLFRCRMIFTRLQAIASLEEDV